MEPLFFIVGGTMAVYVVLDFLTIIMLRRLHDSLRVRAAAGIIAIILGFLILDWLFAILRAGSSGEGKYILLAAELILVRVVYITVWWIVAWVRYSLAVSHGRAAVREDRY